MVTGGKRNKDLLLTGDNIGCADNTQSNDGDKKRKPEDHVGDDKFTDSVVSLSRGIDVKGVATEPCRNEEANDEVTMKASCMAEHFAMTISRKVWNLRITEADLGRIMHITNGGVDVELEGNSEDHQILDLKRRISGNTDITIHGLRRVLIESEHVDGMFRSCLALYAMATVLSPVTSTDMDPRYLIPVKDSRYLCAKNWAKFAFNKLVEGVLSFQWTEVGLEVVPLMFLQLFYLDVVRNDMIFEKKMLKLVMTWEVSDVKRVVDMVDGLGGWESTKVDVSMRHMWDEESENIGSFDKSTGMKTSVVEDLSDVRSEFSVVKWEVGLVRSIVGRLEPDIGHLRGAVTTLETSLNRLQDGGLSRIVSDAVMRIMEVNKKSSSSRTNSHFDWDCMEQWDEEVEYGDRHTFLGVESDGNGLPDNEPGVESYGDGMPNSLTKIFVASPCYTNALDSTESSNFEAVAHISQKESYLLTYLFSKNVSADNAIGSNEVARYGGWAVSRWDLSCLSPRQHVTAEVVNMSPAYLFDDHCENWFMLVTISERAKDIFGGVQLDVVVPSTILTCRLQRFVGQLSLCNKICVPIYDRISNHWFLAVADMLNGVCEIWDCTPKDSAKTCRHDFAFAAAVKSVSFDNKEGRTFSNSLSHSRYLVRWLAT
ncbi:hypothetical protein ACLB2K_039664 [Fragaria x ananassa]